MKKKITYIVEYVLSGFIAINIILIGAMLLSKLVITLGKFWWGFIA